MASALALCCWLAVRLAAATTTSPLDAATAASPLDAATATAPLDAATATSPLDAAATAAAASVPALVADAAAASLADLVVGGGAPAAAATSSTPPAFSPVAAFGTVPDNPGTAPLPTYRGVDMVADGDAVYVSLQDGGRGWKATVVDVGGPRVVDVATGFTPGPAYDLALAAAGGVLATCYRERVYHHGYERDGDDSWAYVRPPGGRFAQAGAAFTNARPLNLSLALDAAGDPVVAYADDEDGLRATVRGLAPDGGWPTVGEQGFSTAAVSGVKLAAAGDGALYVAYNDASCGGRVTVQTAPRHGGNWTVVGRPCFTAGAARGLSLVVVKRATPSPPTYMPCVAYGDAAAGGAGVVACATSPAWPVVGGGPFSSTRTAATSLAYDGQQSALYVAYRDGGYGGRATVSRADSAGWTTLGRRGFSKDAVWRTRVAVTAAGDVYVAAETGANVDEADGVTVYKLGGR